VEDYHSENMEININYIKGGEQIEVSKNISLRAIHTPGHTNGSMSFLIENSEDIPTAESSHDLSTNPYLFTGDTLFVDGVGRPDLREEAKKYAGLLYETYHQLVIQLPENTLILPAHFNGSSITLKHGIPIADTIGSIKEKIKHLSMDKDEFVHFVTDTLPSRPMNYKTIIDINKKILPFDDMQMPDLEAGPNSCAVSMK
jgi:glyoxylase-like metal-dependent hydrolase (beta-lactamase superfamily II)